MKSFAVCERSDYLLGIVYSVCNSTRRARYINRSEVSTGIEKPVCRSADCGGKFPHNVVGIVDPMCKRVPGAWRIDLREIPPCLQEAMTCLEKDIRRILFTEGSYDMPGVIDTDCYSGRRAWEIHGAERSIGDKETMRFSGRR